MLTILISYQTHHNITNKYMMLSIIRQFIVIYKSNIDVHFYYINKTVTYLTDYSKSIIYIRIIKRL